MNERLLYDPKRETIRKVVSNLEQALLYLGCLPQGRKTDILKNHTVKLITEVKTAYSEGG